MNSMVFYCRFMISVLIVLLTASCTKRQLEVDTISTSKVEIRTVFLENGSYEIPCDSVLLFFYRADTLFLREKVSVPYDQIEIPCGEYQIIMLNENVQGVGYYDMSKYLDAKIILNTHLRDSLGAPHNVQCYTQDSFLVVEDVINHLVLEPSNLARLIEYQLVIGGAADSLKRCIVTQPGIARGILIYNKHQILGDDFGARISFEATRENNYSGKINFLGINPNYNTLELVFYFADNKIQRSSMSISTAVNDGITAKKVIMYIDVSVINLEINASVKSWIVVEDMINM